MKLIKNIVLLILVLSTGIYLYFYFYKSSHEVQSQISEDGNKKPNILFITIDTMRADRLGSYGYRDIKTPNIDKIAKNGVLFSQAFSQVPITLPSHSSIFTGLNPNKHNVRENGTFRLAESEMTLAEILRENGYTTAAFIGGFPLDSRFGLNQGFDFYDDDLYEKGFLSFLKLKNKKKRRWQGHKVSSFERPTGDVIESAIKWFSDNRKKNIFIWVHLFDPHSKYMPPKPFNSIYKGRLYDGEVAYVDHSLGELFKRIEKWRILNDTLIIITADHGESLGEHNYSGHGTNLYDQSMRIPLIISYPSLLPQRRVVKNLVRSIDIMPTVLDILEITSSSNIQGLSLTPLIFQNDNSDIKLTSYGETLYPKLRFGGEELRSYQTEKWKYIRYIEDDKIVKEEMFDMQNDPKELINLADKKEILIEKFSHKLNDLMKVKGTSDTALTMDKETENKLKSLGYIQ